MKIFLTILSLFFSAIVFAQNGEVVKCNRYFKDGNYDKAEESYLKAINKKPNTIAQFNLGNTLYKKEKMEDAIKSFDEASANATEPEMKAKALYNKGVLYHKDNKLNDAITAYKEALRLTPDDAEIRKNLQLALKAEQYLKALEQKEKQLQEKMQKKTGVPSQPEKDW